MVSVVGVEVRVQEWRMLTSDTLHLCLEVQWMNYHHNVMLDLMFGILRNRMHMIGGGRRSYS